MERYKYSDEELYIIENSQVPFAVYQFLNKRVVTIALSAGFIDLYGLTDMEKQDVYDLMESNMYRDTHPDDLVFIADEAFRFATNGGVYDVVYRLKKDNEYRIIHAYGKHIFKENGVRLAVVWYTDQGAYVENVIKENNPLFNSLNTQLQERSYTNQAGHDYLTGLPTMTHFFELAESGCNVIRDSGNTPAILFMDFNGMKAFNQKYGLEEGDKFLKSFSEEIIELFSHESCSRFTADHFCAFTDEDTAEKVAAQLLDTESGNGIKRKMPLRVGVYIYDNEEISISGACDRAQLACNSGRNDYADRLYFFDDSMMTALEEKQYVVENIDNAINQGWIKVYYQPIIRTANGKVCHEEALARWIDPNVGFLSPGTFIPVLEDTKTIYKLDLYVVDTVLKKMQTQAEKGLYVVPVSVNLSKSDFYSCNIVNEIISRVDAAKVPRERLVIEITESVVADDVEFMLEEIKRFQENGFSVWMDDYGSGYSSPSILQKIPFDLIKIDMLFVRQLEENDKAKIVLTELVRMAISLGMDTVAEGVETEGQADFLKDIGCTMLQGFYYCKPLPFEEVLERYDKGIQIGFENPKESGYYAKLGKVNLYNLSLSSADGEHLKEDYFDTWPMVIVECSGNKISFVRANVTFKKYIAENFPNSYGVDVFDASKLLDKPGARSLNAVLRCAQDGKRVIVDDRTADGKQIQILASRIALNPLTGVSAIMVAILSSTEQRLDYHDSVKDEKIGKIAEEYAKLQQENARLLEEIDANAKIAELKKSVTALLTNMPAMTFSKDVVTRKYLACNQAFADYAHKETPEGVVGLTDYEIFDAATALHFIEDDKKALAMDKPYIFYEDVPDAVGNLRQFQTTKLRFTDDTGRECLLGLCQDVTDAMRIKREYVQKLEQVQNQANVDALTGIKNKNAYKEKEDIMNRRIAEKRQTEFALSVLDVNNLKEINDTLGHKAGDKYICDACDIICQIFKRSPVYRIGGDEFVVLSLDEDYERIEELVDIVATHNRYALSNGGIIIAYGMAKYMDVDTCMADVFERADRQMYENKSSLKKITKEKL
ncbi:EAL domain-containing protein [Pseudobutyrivibrio xylanivorans]|uniref:EAL domain-containing protein n=1 Tax=Pseudobutyrivibrio xylanivorans TaxID=185007 RepID=A0A5P6VVE2_PSEXY|nr:EAL domain-containing protein [Pseudobutyrivibrio xylanivorans]QFJ56348.1 EAL domain-containing protein [Pseudobutyrivibrio xylanivorans]